MIDAMGNFEVHVIACSSAALSLAVQTACLCHPAAAAWARDGDWLALYWHQPDEKVAHVLATPHKATEIVSLVTAWLEATDPGEPCPNIDGSVSRGFELTVSSNNLWSYEMLRIRPVWALHGK